MRRTKTNDTLVIASDYTKGIYHDKWIGGVLHYTGMGKNEDQDINWAQNATLVGCGGSRTYLRSSSAVYIWTHLNLQEILITFHNVVNAAIYPVSC